jgi:hypothetical protein
MGNDAGDDFGKYPLENGGSTDLFLGDEFWKYRVIQIGTILLLENKG